MCGTKSKLPVELIGRKDEAEKCNRARSGGTSPEKSLWTKFQAEGEGEREARCSWKDRLSAERERGRLRGGRGEDTEGLADAGVYTCPRWRFRDKVDS